MCLDEIERDHESPRKQQSHDQSEAGKVHCRGRDTSALLAPDCSSRCKLEAIMLTVPLSVEFSRTAVQDRVHQQASPSLRTRKVEKHSLVGLDPDILNSTLLLGFGTFSCDLDHSLHAVDEQDGHESMNFGEKTLAGLQK